MDWLTPAYPWIKSAHIAFVIAWMAGLLYLPRLFAYHAEAEAGSDKARTFEIMERRLLRGIMNPAMVGTYVFGGFLLATPGVVDWGMAWIWVKLAAVAVLTVLHHLFAAWRKAFAAGRNRRPGRFYKWVNEGPALLMLVIIPMVVAKPF